MTDTTHLMDLDAALQAGSEQAEGGFDVVRRGYDREQVADAMHTLLARVRAGEAAALAERAARQQAEAVAGAVRAELDEVRRTHGEPSFELLGERVGQILALARDEAAATRLAAAEAVEPQRRAAEAEAHRLVDDARAEALRLLREGEERRAAVETAVETHLRDAEATAAALRAAAQADAERLTVATAERVAATREAAAAEVTRLEERQAQLRAELLRLRDALGIAVEPADRTEAADGAEPAEQAQRTEPAGD